MSFGLLLGILVVLFGVSIILNVVFKINLPFFRIILALLFIYIGVKILLGQSWFCWRGPAGNTIVLHRQEIRNFQSGSNAFQVMFGDAEFDLRNVDWPQSSVDIEVNVVFGNALVVIDKKLPVRVQAEAVFGAAELPGQMAGGIGGASLVHPNYSAQANHIDVKANAVFGRVAVEYR